MKHEGWSLAATAAIALLLPTLQAVAQTAGETVSKAIESARQRNPGLDVRTDPQTGLPTSVKGLRLRADPDVSLSASRDASGKPSKTDIMNAAVAFFKTGALSAAFATQNARAGVEAVLVRDDPDFPGRSIVHVEQRVDGIKVFGSSGRVSVSPSLAVTQLTTTFSTVAVDSTTPEIPSERAVALARQELLKVLAARPDDKSLTALRKAPESARAEAALVIFDPALLHAKGSKPGPARLAWLVTVDAFRMFIDANDSKVLFFYMDQRWAMPQRVFDLKAGYDFPGDQVIDDLSGKRDTPLVEDADNAYANVGRVVAYYADVHQRESLLNRRKDELISSYVRYGDLKNAFWCNTVNFLCPQPDSIVYGVRMPRALDVVGHELTHGVISTEADLTYANEAGAVNESIADIMGTLIEFHSRPTSANWVIGEDVAGYDTTSPVRSLADPLLSDADGNALFDRTKPYSKHNRGQPDHYDAYVKRDDPICETTRDYLTGCVHFNSGIFNKFAFLIAQGGRHRGQVVIGIGREKLGRLTYRALVAHLNPSTTMVEAANAFSDACRELAGGSVAGFTPADCIRIEGARQAVGLSAASS